MKMLSINRSVLSGLAVASLIACASEPPRGLADAQPAATTVAMDFFHRPLPEIPLPNDIATRFDENSPTHRRINASMIAPTQMESKVRRLINEIDGWGTLQAITVPFTAPIDVQTIIDGHRDLDYDFSNDVIYLVNVDRSSENFGTLHHLDLGNGNYPVGLERPDNYWKNDPHVDNVSLLFEENDEDLNGNGILDLGEDLNGNGILDEGEDVDGDGVLGLPEDRDGDGRLDSPNYLPGAAPDLSSPASRIDSLMTFYEKETNTLIAKPLVPLDERTTYAVLVTRRIRDMNGEPVGSPFDFINHTSQTEDLEPLLEVLPEGVAVKDIAFAFSYTTQSIQAPMVALRDGIYGHGVQSHLSREFPAQIDTIEPVRDLDYFESMENPYILYSEDWALAFEQILTQFDGVQADSERNRVIYEAGRYVDYYVIGSFESPQLFERYDDEGNWLPLDDQSWPADIDRIPVKARAESIYFTLSIPRREVSARAEGKHLPIVVMSHGYGSNRFEGMQMAGFFARYGFATISIDGPSHGLPLNELQASLAEMVLTQYGIGDASRALSLDRAYNQDNDTMNTPDSGADFWTAYLFHTRDVVRQFALDYMQMIRMIRSFDGVTPWKFDNNGDGVPEVSGDFDGDGIAEIGSESTFTMVGGSLGGIMTMIMSGLEPQIVASAPLVGGGGFAEMGARTTQSGAVEGFMLRAMGPFFAGTLDAETGNFLMETIVVDLNSDRVLPFANLEGVNLWDTIVVENQSSGEKGCGYVLENGKFRTNLAADAGDRLKVYVYAGPQLAGGEDCALRSDIEPKTVVDHFEDDVAYQDEMIMAGYPLLSVVDGLGLKRCSPDLRRFTGIGQLVLDAADPASFARHVQHEPLYYPGTGERTGTHVLQINSLGDTSVSVASGITWGRAAGTIGYLESDPRFGSSHNQMLIDTHTVEGVHTFDRFFDDDGRAVHLDIENFSQGTDMWAEIQPRSEVPSRIGFAQRDQGGGISAALFPMGDPQGQHGFDLPGIQTDKTRSRCLEACTEEGEDPCGCYSTPGFDVGKFMFNMVGTFLRSGGTQVTDDICQSHDACAAFDTAPDKRDTQILP